MNALFLVSSFLLIFTFFSLSLFKDGKIFTAEQKSICSYIENTRTLENKWENYKYKSSQKKPKKPPSKTKKEKIPQPQEDISTFESHRLRQNLSAVAKWNLATLFTAEIQNSHLQKSVAIFLEDLYGHTFFWKEAQKNKPNLAKDLVNSFLENKNQEITSLSDLFPEDSELQLVFYKMLKGSTLYDMRQKKGHPPLEDFFCFEMQNTKTLYFSYASYPALKAFFGTSLADQILSLERAKREKLGHGYPIVLKQELLELDGQLIPAQDIFSVFDFSHNKTQFDKLTQKGKEQISLKIDLEKKQ